MGRIGFLFLFIAQTMFAQIGIGTLTPNEELEIKGNVAFRKLEAQDTQYYNKQVATDSEGRFGYLNGSIDGYEFGNVYSVFMPNKVIQNNNGDISLNLNHSFDLMPKSSTIVIVTYNIPIYVVSDINHTSVNTVFAGTKLKRKRGSIITDLLAGNRKFSFANIYRGNDQKGMFLEGKFIEVLNNPTSESVTIEYILEGFVEDINNESVYFSVDPNEVDETNGLGKMALKFYIKSL